ncbi:hypothetical protein [Hymenobacter cavernae]|uniref:Uncharacterized protein n=1 Tax=Hymenobacter cavernae TaxID=2044852 RepID=A0ABQ1UR74_9BACT|nr:hypothetical protein [Hymenobacter cavernae]GGF24266.1 hypothetical protein GCM10011383_39880 [Hymenobacter cavernae]
MWTKHKYHPWNAKAQSWDYIENRFATDFSGVHLRLIELVKHIRKSGLSERLFGSTSMDKLVVSIYDPIDYRKEALHITYDLDKNSWTFNYFALPFQDPEFVRTYSGEMGIEKFDKFIKMINW